MYAYRGIQGFTQVTNFNLPSPASTMQNIKLSYEDDAIYRCATNYLMVTTENEVIFYEAKTEPTNVCELKADIKCD